MPIATLDDVYLANDKYRAQLRSTWISSPAATSLAVDAVPDNVPTIVTVGWETDYETVFYVTGKSGDNSSNYSLTGVTRLKGANTNIPENTAVNCLNNEEFLNQYGESINDVIDAVNTSLETVEQISTVVPLTDTASVPVDASAGGTFLLSATGNRTIAVPTNPTDGQKMVIIHHASGGARTLSFATGTDGFIFGDDITEMTETASGDRDVIGCIYSEAIERWMIVAIVKGYAA